MNNIEYFRTLPVRYETEVLVVGGGPAGLCAAISAARNGARTLLIEQNGFCGGMATAGLVAPFMTCYDSAGDKVLIRGIFEEIINRLCESGDALHPSGIEGKTSFTSYQGPGHIHVTPFRAEALKRLADEMLTEAGVKVLYHTSFVDAQREGERVERVIVHTKEGLCAVKADVIVDCSGDADVVAAAGGEYILGNGQGKMQPATMFFRINHVDTAAVDADIEANWDKFYRKDGVNYRSMHWWVEKAREAGDWDLDRVSIGLYRGVDEDEWSINTSRIMGIDGTVSESLTRGEMEGRQQVKQIFNFIKKYIPGCQNASLLDTGSTLGIRETRHIVGLKTLTLSAVLGCEVPDDTVMIAANAVDIHGKFGPRSNEYITLEPGKGYGVPYGCLVPRGFENLLVAGRCLSAESEAAGSVRVMPPCMAMGEAAGAAAALAVKTGATLPRLDVAELRRMLKAQNVCLHYAE